MTETRTTLREHESKLVVASRTSVAEGVLELRLARRLREGLPPWTPGAHVDLVLGDDLVRQYSLCGDPTDDELASPSPCCASRSRAAGRRSSTTQLAEGDRLTVRGPRNHFPLVAAPRYRFIAGGIGITPLLPMIAEAEASGADWSLDYGGRTRASMAYPDAARGVRRPGRVCPDRRVRACSTWPRSSASPGPGTLVYCCGPEGLLRRR